MSPSSIRLLALSGSLRQASSNTALLDAAQILTPDHIQIDRFKSITDLPHFNPDIERNTPLPKPVSDLRTCVAQADGLIISCPEYARGVPGSFKNALDWLVGSASDNKSIVLWNAAPRARDAQNALRLILSTMLGSVIESACLDIPISGKKMTAEKIATDPEFASIIATTLSTFADHIRTKH